MVMSVGFYARLRFMSSVINLPKSTLANSTTAEFSRLRASFVLVGKIEMPL